MTKDSFERGDVDLPEGVGFKPCYRHPKRPAIKNCKYCGRPMCRECEVESGDHRLCAPCKKKLVNSAMRDSAAPAPSQVREAETIDLGELTVLDDGTVVGGEEHRERPTEGAGNEITKETRPLVGHGPQAGAPAPQHTGDTNNEEDRAGAPGAGGAEGAAVGEEPGSSGRVEKAAELEPPVEEPPGPRYPGGLRQVYYALPFAASTALLLAVCWLLIAVLLEQWTQVAVATLGLAVPWVFYNASTRKKVDGRRVWKEAPLVLVSIFSFGLVVLVALLLEFLVFQLVYADYMRIGLFIQSYFDAVGWVLVGLGLAFSLLLPFLLSFFGRWDLPSFRFRRRRKLLEMKSGVD